MSVVLYTVNDWTCVIFNSLAARPRDSYATVHGSNEGGSASAAEPQ